MIFFLDLETRFITVRDLQPVWHGWGNQERQHLKGPVVLVRLTFSYKVGTKPQTMEKPGLQSFTLSGLLTIKQKEP